MKLCRSFLFDERGAVTVDWVVLTSGVVVLGALVAILLGDPLMNLLAEIRAEILEYSDLLQ